MGCDIHFVVEFKCQDTWVGVFSDDVFYSGFFKSPYPEREKTAPIIKLSERDYNFFAALANVRGPGPDALGLPDDISSLTKMRTDYWSIDGHSHSYMSLQDFVLTKAKVSDKLAPEVMRSAIETGSGINALSRFMPEDDLDKYRVVFWFDN